MFQNVRYFSVAVPNLEEAMERYEKLFGLKPMSEPREQRWGFKGVMMGAGEARIVELVQPSDPTSALARFMKERSYPSNPNGEGIYLVSVAVDDIGKAVQQIKDGGGRVTQVEESPNVAWVHPTSSNFAFIELTQPSE